MAQRPRPAPALAASTTARTAWRTSSSGSETLSARNPPPELGRCGTRKQAAGSASAASKTGTGSGARPSRDSEAFTAASASAAPVLAAITVMAVRSAVALSSRAWPLVSRWGKKTMSAPSSATGADPRASASTASSIRSCSSWNLSAKPSLTARWIRTTSLARAEAAPSRSRPGPGTSESSRWALTKALSVAGWPWTPAK